MWTSKAIISNLVSCGLMLSLACGVASAQIPNSTEPPNTQFRRIEQPLLIKGAVTGIGLALISLEIWWFLLSKPKISSDRVHSKLTK
ncbi:hypothetical protein ACX27_03150 [Nostoc piscinale CENA21]|uniref:Uncharacterized protein n=1 Tax=Nostoc piscinale CENA21 TaxID=224013 RepID=A0A0M4TTZ3_9NOSO|nr:hypothetical protein [Nostoc piscinale]ALF52076.1 hypothetical protein ACX27_03150 [Nostoc piscinale CENA21]